MGHWILVAVSQFAYIYNSLRHDLAQNLPIVFSSLLAQIRQENAHIIKECSKRNKHKSSWCKLKCNKFGEIYVVTLKLTIIEPYILVSETSQRHIKEFWFWYLLPKSSTKIWSLNIRPYLRDLSEMNLQLEESDQYIRHSRTFFS